MRIMIVTDQYPPMVGGVPTVTHDLAHDFATRDHQVWVVAPSYGPRDIRRLEGRVRTYRYSSFEWPLYEGQHISLVPILPLRNLIKKSDPDVIHVHSPIVLGNLAQILAGGLRKPVIATNHYLPIGIAPRAFTTESLFGKPINDITYSYLVYFCNRCEYVTAPTKTALNLLYEHGLRAPARAISNGIDLNKYTPGPRNPDILRRYGLPEDRPIAMHVNRLSEEKRNDVLLDAIPLMQTRAHIALAGKGPAEADLRAQARRLHIEDRVSFLGYVPDDDLLELRRSVDAFVIPSEADLQSLSTMEAMACGLPVIAANSYALPELCHHEENGFLFQPGNSEELAHYLDTLLADAALRQRMGEESLKIIARHDRAKVLDEWETLYQRLSLEFKEAKERREQLRLARRYHGYVARDTRQVQHSRITRTDALAYGRPREEQKWRLFNGSARHPFEEP
ncbi:MAG: glycosyltransferase [Ktedonobacteraceae bacterium]|nr:glycosyltransferase [Ktedonobacteraceae bacterium]